MRVALAAAALLLFGAGCQTSRAFPTQPTGTLRGVSLSPKSFSPEDFETFFRDASDAGSAVTWAGDWIELAAPTGAPVVVAELAKPKKYTPVIIAQVFDQDTGNLRRPLTPHARKTHVAQAESFAKKYHPPFFGLGIEVNMLAERSPDAFDQFVALFDEAADAIKRASPETRIFPVLQLERLKGLRGGLFGGKNDETKNDWALLEKFPKADLIAFTSYPGIIYKDPDDIPDDYYQEIRKRTDRPIAFTELGWSAAASPAGWESSEEEQTRFVSRFRKLTAGFDPQLEIWSFLYDQPLPEPFTNMGLRRADGSARPALEEWKK
ncbi:hypothetical protein HY479_02070 [Candidatus Uhrbacteria bacterium]|nr:hypothetical protein [Candidatus Uhrbacteria bacterium]